MLKISLFLLLCFSAFAQADQVEPWLQQLERLPIGASMEVKSQLSGEWQQTCLLEPNADQVGQMDANASAINQLLKTQQLQGRSNYLTLVLWRPGQIVTHAIPRFDNMSAGRLPGPQQNCVAYGKANLSKEKGMDGVKLLLSTD